MIRRMALVALLVGCSSGGKVGDTTTTSTTMVGGTTPGGIVGPTTGPGTTTATATTGTGTGSGTGTGTGSTTTPSPCVTAVPASAVVVDTDQGTTTTDTYWVCPHNALFLTASNSVVLLEADADLVVNGQPNEIWLKAGSDVAVLQDGSTFFYEDPASVAAVNPTTNTLIQCSSITFDYVNAPYPGC